MECVQFDLELDLFPHRIVSLDGNDDTRTEGLHLTNIIRDIMESSGMSKSVSGASWGNSQLSLAAEVGFIWEEILSSALKSRLPNRIGEIEVGGIYMSPDGLDVEEWCLWEYKAAWASSRRLPTENWKWMAQAKGYCYGLQVEVVRMAILYLNGDWKGGGPEYRGYKITFSPTEIAENWTMLVNHARNRGWL